MPTITIRVSEQERASLERAASLAGTTLSDYIRQILAVRHEKNIIRRVAQHEARLGRIERKLAAILTREEELHSVTWEDVDPPPA